MSSTYSIRPSKGIRNWPAEERPREKLIQRGAASLSDAELLAIFIRSGTAGRTAVDIARELLSRFGSLRGLLGAEFHQVTDVAGLGPAKFAQLKAVLELGQRYLGESIRPGQPLNDPEAVRRYLAARLRDLPYEVFCCLYLDNRHRVVAFEQLFRGTINGAAVYPREVVKQALSRNAAAVILVHNHPSGVAEPSRADTLLTRRVKEALDLVDIRVLDHLVVGDGEMTSFCERGLL
ncbi:MAG: RadC family protein [Acidiferrobacterales bacterium]